MEKLRVLQIEFACPINDRVINPYNAASQDMSITPGDDLEHAEIVYSILDKLPEDRVDIYFATPGSTDKALDEIKPHILVASIGAIRGTNLAKHKHRTLMIVAAGNEGMLGESELASMNCTTAVGAIFLDGRIKSYSSRGKGHVRFVQPIPPSFTYMMNGQPVTKSKEGTSFTCPLQALEFSKLYLAYQDKYGVFPTVANALNIAILNVIDVGPKGFDQDTGYGMFNYNPNTSLEVPRLQAYTKEIKLTIGSNVAFVDGVLVKLDTAPIIDSNWRTLVPVRFIAESLGAEVKWNGDTQEVTIIMPE